MLPYFMIGKFSIPAINFMLDILFYCIVALSVILNMYFLRFRLLEQGYSDSLIKRSYIWSFVIIIPSAFVSSQLGTMFYYDPSLWSFKFFISNMFAGVYTYHTSIILPAILVSIYIINLKVKFFEVLDAVFLYIPVAHAFGRISCLLIGCCWGKKVSINLFGTQIYFDNPIPLYEIAANMVIFLVLRKWYEKIYSSSEPRFRGSIMPLYLVLYGIVRFIIEYFRTENIVSFNLTQAQMAMMVFTAAGLLWIGIIALKEKHSSAKK
jgi:prolipoprotein diacylglyceryltransferase